MNSVNVTATTTGKAVIYAQYNNSEETQHIKRQRETAALFKEMKEWSDVLNLRLEIWCRSGPSEELRKGISEAATEYGCRFEKMMGSSPPRITKR